MREIVNAIFYINRSGCQWDICPTICPPRAPSTSTSPWREDGTWQKFVDACGKRSGRRSRPRSHAECREHRQPNGEKPGQPAEDTGYDGAKKITGRKRHMAVDTLGLLLAVVVTSAAIDDAAAAPAVLGQLTAEKFPRLKVIWTDNKYHNHKLLEWVHADIGRRWKLTVVKRPEGTKGFVLLEKRWVVERTHAWIGRCRRHSRDYERYRVECRHDPDHGDWDNVSKLVAISKYG